MIFSFQLWLWELPSPRYGRLQNKSVKDHDVESGRKAKDCMVCSTPIIHLIITVEVS